ncbi:MAG TPA: flagellar biosynthetic protein FliQ [Candidatus Eremiobacteraceae bacterium]|nr:flagellar biosynthetic protein FliQ [Candidatus Eremiobacteraceae bacterium]
MEHAAAELMARALETALLISVPLVAAVAMTGVVTGAIQTIVQVQDQNVAFLPKLLIVALLITVAGAPALMLLVRLFSSVAAGIPRLLGL